MSVRTARQRLSVLIALLLWGLLTHSTYAGSGDEPHYLAIAHSLAFDRDVDLSNNYKAGDWITGAAIPGAHVVAGRDGTMRPVHDIGMPLLFAPYVAVLRPVLSMVLPRLPSSLMERFRLAPETMYRHLLSLGMVALTLVLADQLMVSLIGLGATPLAAASMTALMVLSPPLLVHAILLFSEILSALLCVVLFRHLVVDQTDRVGPMLAAGVATGLLLLVHTRNAGLVVAFTAIVFWRARRSASLNPALAFAAGAAAAFTVRAAITLYFWGTWVTTPHAAMAAWPGLRVFTFTVIERLGGLLFDQEYGLLPYAPVFLACAFAVGGISGTQRRALRAAATIACAYMVLVLTPITNVHGWTGGWSPAARFWVPIVPLLAIGAAVGLMRAPRAIAVALVTIQLSISAYFWQNPKNLWNDGDGVAAICERGGAPFCGWLPSFVTPADRVTLP